MENIKPIQKTALEAIVQMGRDDGLSYGPSPHMKNIDRTLVAFLEATNIAKYKYSTHQGIEYVHLTENGIELYDKLCGIVREYTGIRKLQTD